MIKEIIAQGKDVVEAKENARAALGAGPLDDVTFEILHAGSRRQKRRHTQKSHRQYAQRHILPSTAHSAVQ